MFTIRAELKDTLFRYSESIEEVNKSDIEDIENYFKIVEGEYDELFDGIMYVLGKDDIDVKKGFSIEIKPVSAMKMEVIKY